MNSKFNKLCLVQPSNDFQVSVHKHALALTFPYLIQEFSLDTKFQLSLYVEDKNNITFEEFLDIEVPDLIFITVNTATFPNSVRLAKCAKKSNCRVVLGGIFATLNAEIISANYDCFDQIIKGIPPKEYFNSILEQRIINGRRSFDINFRISEILKNKIFDFYKNDPVCYEITFGCVFNCSFCSLRSVWGPGICSRRDPGIVTDDLRNLTDWDSLKIIDDDILQSTDILAKCEISSHFKKIVAETRVDRINNNSIKILKDLGITHLIMGVESFDQNNLNSSMKTRSYEWTKKTMNAIELCVKNNIIPRPVFQFLYPEMSKDYIKKLTPLIKEWTPKNGIELFFVFFTPHPGMGMKIINNNNLITNDLSKFDHLNPVYIPNNYNVNDTKLILDQFNNLVDLTESIKYNPHIITTGDYIKEYDIFFKS